ncbi:TPA: hypothetical protein IAA87_05755 [Candidatus Avigastranaerophilus faecigallinarum]|nr:hypothetical protein [Candidatus Avigastranaerophilus faecigallinarum]
MAREKKFKDSQLGAGDYMKKFIREATQLTPEEEKFFQERKKQYMKELKKYEKLTEDSYVGFGRSIYISEKTSDRENKIIELLCIGYNYKEISQMENVTLSTVKTHVNHIFQKKGVSSLQELIVLSLTNQLKGKSLLEIQPKKEETATKNDELDFLSELLG